MRIYVSGRMRRLGRTHPGKPVAYDTVAVDDGCVVTKRVYYLRKDGSWGCMTFHGAGPIRIALVTEDGVVGNTRVEIVPSLRVPVPRAALVNIVRVCRMSYTGPGDGAPLSRDPVKQTKRLRAAVHAAIARGEEQHY